MSCLPASIVALHLLGVAQSGFKVDPPDFSNYPKTESFRAYFSIHSIKPENRHNANLLVISAFRRGSSSALEYFISQSGEVVDQRHVFNWAIQARRQRQLSAENLASLRATLRELPAGSPPPPLERLVIVSFRDGANWVTRLYDSTNLSKPMRKVYDLVGERFESKSPK